MARRRNSSVAGGVQLSMFDIMTNASNGRTRRTSASKLSARASNT
nr:MAG TPA: hypothetical protein [Caudoviricetes sp.]